MEIWGLSRQEISVNFFSAVNHRPRFFTPNFTQVSVPRKTVFFFCRKLLRSGHLSPRSRRTPEAQRLLRRPLPLSLRAITCRPATITLVIEMKDRSGKQSSQNKKVFTTNFRGYASAGGAALILSRRFRGHIAA